MVSWRDIEDKNQTMAVSAYLKLARTNSLIPTMLNVETLAEFISQVIPPITPEEYKYIESKALMTVYNQDMNPAQTSCEPVNGEPGLLFHEFIFLMGIIALHCMGTSPSTSSLIEDFFVEKLNFTRVDPDSKLKCFEDFLEDDGVYSDYESGSGSELEMDEQQKAFMEFLQERAAAEADFVVDFESILERLDETLPMIPGKPEVQEVKPPGEKDPLRILFGKLMPKEKSKDDKKKKKAVKKAPKAKKGEKPPPPLRWADVPEPTGPSTLDLIRKATQQVNDNIFPQNIRGEHCNPGVMPTIIKEVFFPPDAPMEVATLMESSLVYQNSANYEMAVKSLEMARDRWRILAIPPPLPSDESPVKVNKKDKLSAPPVPVMLRAE